MTREEMKMRKLVRESDVIDKTNGTELAKAFNYLWKKYIEQEPCEDAVSRRAAIEIARSNIHYGLDKEYECSRELLEKTIAEINSLPPVTPTRPNAHNNNEDYAECDQFVCSNCGIELQDWHRVERDEDDGEVSYHEYTFKFCPNCGAETESGDKK